jgi:hypothetical protein
MSYTNRKRQPRQQAPGTKECCPYGRAVARRTKNRKRKQKLVHVGYGKFVVVEE